MGKEIERKFLIKNKTWKNQTTQKITIKQGYLNDDPDRTVRIRIQDTLGLITVKGRTKGLSRAEFEYEIPLEDAVALLQLCKKPLIEKNRFLVLENNLKWEIDVFEGDNDGLQIAEVELESEDQVVSIPQWVGEEVTEDARYYNSNLAVHPFIDWDKESENR